MAHLFQQSDVSMSLEQKGFLGCYSTSVGWTEILLDFRQWPDATDDEKGELLLQGSQQGDQVLVSNLLEEAAPVDQCDADGKTALRVAIDHDHDTIVSLLLAKGANCNIPDANGQAPLHVCSELGKETVADMLLRAGAHVNMTDTQNLWTPLHAAVNFGYGDIAVRLLRNRSDINARDKKQRTPLHIAIRVGNGRMVRTLAPNSDVDSKDKKGKTALYIAARYGRDDGAKVLLDNGADRDIPDSGHGWTPLHLCARYSRNEVAKLLLMSPCNTDLADKEEGQTALHIAANYSSEKLVDYLLDANCDMNCLDHGGRTALYWAAHNDGACTRKLIRKGADILKGDTTKLRVLLQDYGRTTEEAENMMRNGDRDGIISTLSGRRRRI
ncbi:hypothetical protein INS49_005430 [Diaporthe citri]|uniref:uncharacterized protein n=1 Tax=Diaporthe citri TaxID=83186 RepID=UPI001C7E67F0|nr:uncharacterized protein INS49_005430 [Diaporthe citri]KAG6353721.1 hypothetical protein INS49_005430 [Diaporthe citri]